MHRRPPTRIPCESASLWELYTSITPNKDSQLASLLKQHHADVGKAICATFTRLGDTSVRLEDVLQKFLTDLMALHQENPALAKTLNRPGFFELIQ